MRKKLALVLAVVFLFVVSAAPALAETFVGGGSGGG